MDVYSPRPIAAISTPPKSTDFSRVTTRYMVEARVRVRANLTAGLSALASAVVPWSGVAVVTRWLWRGHPPIGGTSERPGHGQVHRVSLGVYAGMLDARAQTTCPKGQGPAVSWSLSRHGGRFDDECAYRTGMFLDSDGCGGWEGVRALSRSVGLSFVAQRRPTKPQNCHVEIPYARPWVPVPGDDHHVARWKSEEYCPRLGYLMGIFSELGGLRFEPTWDDGGHASAKYAGFDTACDQLVQLNFVYTRRPDDPAGFLPVTDHNFGGALDVDALLAATGYADARAALTVPRTSARIIGRSATGPAVSRAIPSIGSAGSLSEVVARLLRLRRPESKKLVAPLLAGTSYAPRGERNATMFRIASVLAAIAPDVAPAQLARLFEKSLTVMSKEPGAQPATNYVATKLALAAAQIERVQRNRSARHIDNVPGAAK